MLAVGAAAFTFLMCLDIWFWGDMMRRELFEDKQVFGMPENLFWQDWVYC